MGGLDTLVAQLTETLRATGSDRAGGGRRPGPGAGPQRARALQHRHIRRIHPTKPSRPMGPPGCSRATSTACRCPAVSGIRWATVTARYSLARLRAQYRLAQRASTAVARSLVFGFLASVLCVRAQPAGGAAGAHAAARACGAWARGTLDTRVPPLRGRRAGRARRQRQPHGGGAPARAGEPRAHRRRAHPGAPGGSTPASSAWQSPTGSPACSTTAASRRRSRPSCCAASGTSGRWGVLMIDVDFFKRVNDAMGHPAGDELLRRLADGARARSPPDRSHRALRRRGVRGAAARDHQGRGDAGRRAHAGQVEEKVNHGAPWPMRITVSIGVATFPEDGKTPEDLLVAADQALYVAKRKGRNRVRGARDLRGGMIARLALLLALFACACEPWDDRSPPSPPRARPSVPAFMPPRASSGCASVSCRHFPASR